jgi:caffeoyl-CoA O-methyltransferase
MTQNIPRQKAFGQGDPELATYAEELFRPVDPILNGFVERSRAAGLPEIQVGPMDGRHLEILSRMIQPSIAIEIGTLGGYSALCIARGMKSGGTLHSFEKSELHAKVAEENLRSVKLDVEFKVHVGSALENLNKIEASVANKVDLVFIDADKPGYPSYFEWAVKNLRRGGAIIGDNTFAWGGVHKWSTKTGNDLLMASSLHKFNELVATSSHLRSTIFPTAEGLTVGIRI